MRSADGPLLILGLAFLLLPPNKSLIDGRKSKLRKIRQEIPDRHATPHHAHLDLDYARLLKRFGVESDNTSDLADQPVLRGNLRLPNHAEELKPKTALCDFLQCDHGRVCRVSNNGEEECICRDRCSARQNPVCGSDGNWYHNHCELHRTSCVKNLVIRIAQSTGLCGQKKSFTTEEPKTTTKLAEFCNKAEYAKFKEKLLLYFYDRLVPVLRTQKSSMDKRQLIRDMLDMYDEDKNGKLSQQELRWTTSGEEMDNILSASCQLDDLLRNEDLKADGELSLDELFSAYGLQLLADADAPPRNPVETWIGNVGNSMDIPCSVVETPNLVTWERNHVVLSGLEEETGVRIGSSGSLYITHAQLIHAGNYSCYANHTPNQRQIHNLRVLLLPEVEVQPRQHFYRLQENVSLQCHAVGVPRPLVKWMKNDQSVEHVHGIKITGNGSRLSLSSAAYKDTGVYTCSAENLAGSASDMSSVFVTDGEIEEHPPRKLLMIFYANGIAVYEPVNCRLRFHIRAKDIIPGHFTNDLICGQDNCACQWGDAVNVMDRYVYASQPLLNRIVVISMDQMTVVQVIKTDNVPVKMSYVPHLDQMWVLCWSGAEGEGHVKTIQVIQDASVKTIHTAIHPEPLDGKYQTVADLFIPPVQELAHKYIHAYAVHSNGHSLYKIDMRTLKFIRTVDLTTNNCRPRKITYSSLGGLIFIDCVDIAHGTPKGQLIIDYLTNAVLHHDETINGVTFVSPDSRFWVNLGTDVIHVQEMTEAGLVYLYDIVSTLHIADVTFHPSRLNHSYDLFATALTREQLLMVELASNRLSTIHGVGYGSGRKFNHWETADSRFVSSGGLFSSHVVSAAKEAVFVTNTETKSVNCEISGLSQPQHAVWIANPSRPDDQKNA